MRRATVQKNLIGRHALDNGTDKLHLVVCQAENLEGEGKMGIDPRLMNAFRIRMMNPVHRRNARNILRSYNYGALQDPNAVGTMIDSMCGAMGASITPAQRAAAIRCVVGLRCNPRHPGHRALMRGMVFGY
jgi:hypothetical protein